MKTPSSFLFYSACTALIGLSFSCTSPSRSQEQGARMKDSVATTLADTSLLVHSKDFMVFIEDFSAVEEQAKLVFNEAWSEAFTRLGPMKEISPKYCEQYLYGHSLLGEGGKPKKLGRQEDYYYLQRISLSAHCYGLLFLGFEGETQRVYCCTYTADGNFQAGLVLWKAAGGTTYCQGSIEGRQVLVEDLRKSQKHYYQLQANGSLKPSAKPLS